MLQTAITATWELSTVCSNCNLVQQSCQATHVAVQGPRCSIRSRAMYSDCSPAYLKMTALNLPAAVAVCPAALATSILLYVSGHSMMIGAALCCADASCCPVAISTSIVALSGTLVRCVASGIAFSSLYMEELSGAEAYCCQPLLTVTCECCLHVGLS